MAAARFSHAGAWPAVHGSRTVAAGTGGDPFAGKPVQVPCPGWCAAPIGMSGWRLSGSLVAQAPGRGRAATGAQHIHGWRSGQFGNGVAMPAVRIAGASGCNRAAATGRASPKGRAVDVQSVGNRRRVRTESAHGRFALFGCGSRRRRRTRTSVQAAPGVAAGLGQTERGRPVEAFVRGRRREGRSRGEYRPVSASSAAGAGQFRERRAPAGAAVPAVPAPADPSCGRSTYGWGDKRQRGPAGDRPGQLGLREHGAARQAGHRHRSVRRFGRAAGGGGRVSCPLRSRRAGGAGDRRDWRGRPGRRPCAGRRRRGARGG